MTRCTSHEINQKSSSKALELGGREQHCGRFYAKGENKNKFCVC
jgi:hypothetical protein